MRDVGRCKILSSSEICKSVSGKTALVGIVRNEPMETKIEELDSRRESLG
jgi:hypothetical protein